MKKVFTYLIAPRIEVLKLGVRSIAPIFGRMKR